MKLSVFPSQTVKGWIEQSKKQIFQNTLSCSSEAEGFTKCVEQEHIIVTVMLLLKKSNTVFQDVYLFPFL